MEKNIWTIEGDLKDIKQILCYHGSTIDYSTIIKDLKTMISDIRALKIEKKEDVFRIKTMLDKAKFYLDTAKGYQIKREILQQEKSCECER